MAAWNAILSKWSNGEVRVLYRHVGRCPLPLTNSVSQDHDEVCKQILFMIPPPLHCLCAGGEVCRLGKRWVVNASGGLESKGMQTCVVYCFHTLSKLSMLVLKTELVVLASRLLKFPCIHSSRAGSVTAERRSLFCLFDNLLRLVSVSGGVCEWWCVYV